MKLTTMQDVLRAQKRIRPYLLTTPIEESPSLGANIYLKLENLNKTHSFKIRGALNAMLALSDEERAVGIVACSAGNHAQGVAYAAKMSGVPAKVVMPAHTPKRKITGARRFGAEIILHGDTYDDAELHARKMESQIGMTFISPYNNTQVVAGQGTVALELFDEIPNLGRVIVPTSGGGLLGGVGLVCKTLNPDCEVIGAQSITTAAMHNFFYGTNYPQRETLADGLSGEIEAGSITLDLCKTYADQIVLVGEDEIADAVRWMLFEHNWVIEGAGAVGIAALRKGAILLDDRPTVVIISGGNIDYEVLKGLIA
jgi:threonine dehydratase